MANDRHRRGDELQLIRRLAADLDEPVLGIVATDLLRLGKVVEVLFHGQEVGKRTPASPAARVGRNLDLRFDGLAVVGVCLELGFVEQSPLLGRDLLAPGSEALGAEQAVPLFEEREAFGLLLDR